MKKIFSVFLMVCILLTSLSVCVSADYALDGTDHVFTFNTADEVGKWFRIGDWYLSNGTNEVKLGSFDFEDNNVILGMNFKKIDLDAGTLPNPGVAATFSIRGDVTTGRASAEATVDQATYSHGFGDSEIFANYIMNNTLAAVDGEAKTGKVVKYTMYAYSAKETGEPLVVDYAVTVTSNADLGIAANSVIDVDQAKMKVPASELYSADGIPHKIDFIIYYTSTGTTPFSGTADSSAGKVITTAVYYEIYIDGLYYTGNKFRTNDTTHPLNSTKTRGDRYSWIAPHIDIVADGTNAVTWADTEMYICTNPAYASRKALTDTSTGKYLTVHAFNEIDSQLFQTVDFGDFSDESTRTLRSGFVTGVDSDLAAALEASYTSGSQTVEVSEDIYNDPASIWGTNASSNVSLVKISSGDVYGVEDAASVEGNFANYLISVNGVYVKVEKEETEVPADTAITYDAATKTATLNVATLPAGTTKLQIVVAAYNADGKVLNVKASDSKTDLISNITYTIDGNFPTDASKYKVFVFDSLTSAKPIIEALEQ